MDIVIQDLKFVFRSVARRPGFTAAVLLTLGLGIGANTAIFSVVDGVLLNPLPFEAADRLVTPNVMSTPGLLHLDIDPALRATRVDPGTVLREE